MKKTDLINKMLAVESRIASEKGPFVLFALFQREDDSLGQWDLVFAAPWADADPIGALYYVDKILQVSLNAAESVSISMIAPVQTQDPGVKEVLDTVAGEHGLAEIRNKEFFDKPIKRAYIIIAKSAQPLPA